MTRVVRSAWLGALACVVSVSAAQAQSLTDLGKLRVGGAGALTFGTKTSAAGGAEVDYRINDTFEVFVEGGRMMNVATLDAENRAKAVGTYIGGTGEIKQAVNYFTAGVNYFFPLISSGFATGWTPYVGGGAGIGRIVNKPTFVVNGSDVTATLFSQYGVELGNDLADATNKTMITVNAGARRILSGHITLDLSYRFNRIMKSADIVDDVTINTNRVQGGVGISF